MRKICRHISCNKGIFAGVLVSLILTAGYSPSALSGEARPEEKNLETRIVAVSIYDREAQIVRRGEIKAATGVYRFRCDDLPEKFVESSLKIEGSGSAGARIIGIDLLRRKKGDVEDPRYKELSTRLEELEKKKKDLEIKSSVLVTRRELMHSLVSYERDAAKDKLAGKGFSPQEWKALLDFMEKEGIDIDLRSEGLNVKIQEVMDEIRWVLSEMRAMRTGEGAAKSVQVDCEVTEPGDLVFEISYLVGNTSWNPEYSLRYFRDDDEIEIAYNARIAQATGEDWNGVSLLLSTARPQSGAAPPALLPHFLGSTNGMISGSVFEARTGRPLHFANVVIDGSRMGAMTREDGSFVIPDIPEGIYNIKVMMMGYRIEEKRGVAVGAGRTTNLVFRLHEQVVGRTNIRVEAEAGQMAVDEVVSAVALKSGVVTSQDDLHVRGGREGEVKTIAQAEADVSRTSFAANLQIESPVDLETGAEPKRVLVMKKRLEGEFDLYAVPRLSKDVYMKGKVDNKLGIPLLEGSSEVYIESVPAEGMNSVSDFVGREWIETVAAGEEFSLHLGVDQDIKVDHRLDKKEYLEKPGKKYQKILYRYVMTVESFKSVETTVELADRLPVSTRKEIVLEDILIEPAPTERTDKGLLKWELLLAPGEKREIVIEYRVKFPGDMNASQINLRD